MNAVMYGAGNIGRGFVGALFSQSGYRVTFIDVAKAVVERLHLSGRYPVRIVSDEGNRDTEITGVDAVDGGDPEAAAQAIAEADIMATAVGVKALPLIMPNLVSGLRRRFALGRPPLNILLCENLNDVHKVVEGLLRERMTAEEARLLNDRVGLVEASIGRMVPVQTPEMQDGDPLRVCVEAYGFLPVDRAAFRGGIPSVRNMIPFSPFDFYVKRKLFLHNMGHAACAYLGLYTGRRYIWEAVGDPLIELAAQNAMQESAVALSKKYGVPLPDLLDHAQDLLGRFGNSALKDTCARVAADPGRKLAASDRLTGAARLCLQTGVTPAFISLAAAGAVRLYLEETGREQTGEGAARALRELSELSPGDEPGAMILGMHGLLAARRPPEDLYRAAKKLRLSRLGEII